MEYTKETHWSNTILNSNFKVTNNIKRKEFVITGNMNLTPVEVELDNNKYWIRQSELDILKENNLTLNNIKLVTYTEGLISPLINSKNIKSTMDAYKMYIMY